MITGRNSASGWEIAGKPVFRNFGSSKQEEEVIRTDRDGPSAAALRLLPESSFPASPLENIFSRPRLSRRSGPRHSPSRFRVGKPTKHSFYSVIHFPLAENEFISLHIFIAFPPRPIPFVHSFYSEHLHFLIRGSEYFPRLIHHSGGRYRT